MSKVFAISRYVWSMAVRRNRQTTHAGEASVLARWDRAGRRWVERDSSHKVAGA
jgi:hypothetical protein